MSPLTRRVGRDSWWAAVSALKDDFSRISNNTLQLQALRYSRSNLSCSRLSVAQAGADLSGYARSSFRALSITAERQSRSQRYKPIGRLPVYCGPEKVIMCTSLAEAASRVVDAHRRADRESAKPRERDPLTVAERFRTSDARRADLISACSRRSSTWR